MTKKEFFEAVSVSETAVPVPGLDVYAFVLSCVATYKGYRSRDGLFFKSLMCITDAELQALKSQPEEFNMLKDRRIRHAKMCLFDKVEKAFPQGIEELVIVNPDEEVRE